MRSGAGDNGASGIGSGYRTVKNILASGLDRVPLDESAPSPLPAHDNIRGAAYYKGD